MDYTTLDRVKSELHAKSSVDDALLQMFLTSASRAFDRLCTGVQDASNYFALETVTDNNLEGLIDWTGGRIVCYPHKPIITAVISFDYQARPVDPSYNVPVARTMVYGPRVEAYPESMSLNYPSICVVDLSYTGGLAVSGSAMPEDLQEIVALFTIRMYREAESGMADVVGIAELGTTSYTKALPVRMAMQLEYYRRKQGWRHAA